jgi:hypothetical protein
MLFITSLLNLIDVQADGPRAGRHFLAAVSIVE